MVTYNNASEYINSSSDIPCRIERIEKVIGALINKMTDMAVNADLKEYQLDDGQTKIRAVYNSIEEVSRSIQSLERLKITLINSSKSRVFVLRDARGL